MAVIIVKTLSDYQEGLYGIRDSAEHAADIGTVIAWLRGEDEGAGVAGHVSPSTCVDVADSYGLRLPARRMGKYQFAGPNIAIVAGRRRARTRVMSRNTAAASAKPNCWSSTMEPDTNPRNAAHMMSPAAVTKRPVLARPVTTAVSFVAPASHASRIRETRKTS